MCKIRIFQQNLSTIFLKVLNIYSFSEIFQKVKIVKFCNIWQKCWDNISVAMKDWKYSWHVFAIICAMWAGIRRYKNFHTSVSVCIYSMKRELCILPCTIRSYVESYFLVYARGSIAEKCISALDMPIHRFDCRNVTFVACDSKSMLQHLSLSLSLLLFHKSIHISTTFYLCFFYICT